jgi:hypothetical protein
MTKRYKAYRVVQTKRGVELQNHNLEFVASSYESKIDLLTDLRLSAPRGEYAVLEMVTIEDKDMGEKVL